MSQAELRDLFEALGAEASTAFRLVPIDPCRALATGNARLVRREVRIRALRAWWDARKRGCSGEQEEQGGAGREARATKKRYNVGSEQEEQGGAGSEARDAYMAALDKRGPDEGAVIEGPGLAMSVDEAENERQQHDDGEAEKEELDDDDDDEDGEDDDNDNEAKTVTATEAATAVAMKTTTATGTGTAHGDVGV